MRTRLLLTFVLSIAVLGALLARPARTALPYEPFEATAYWRTPATAAPDPNSDAMIAWLSSVLRSDRQFVTVRASNLNGSTAQGTSIYYASSTAPSYSICHNPNFKTYTFPPEATSVRIPSGAAAPTDNDGDMMVYNQFAGKLFWFTHMALIGERWCASQMSVYYTASNGLIGALPQSDEPRNWGKHGLAPVTQGVRWAEVGSGLVPHVMDIYLPSISCNADDQFPLSTGTMCTTTAANSIPAGAVLRIKPSFNLNLVSLNPTARIIAQALQTYGAIVGDRSGVGNNATVKLEDTVVEGKGNLWLNAGLKFDSLKSIPISAYQVDTLGAAR